MVRQQQQLQFRVQKHRQRGSRGSRPRPRLINRAEANDAVKKAALAAIRAVDEDANGKVSFEELKRVINPDTLPTTIMGTLDKDRDGQFSFDEFRQLAVDFAN